MSAPLRLTPRDSAQEADGHSQWQSQLEASQESIRFTVLHPTCQTQIRKLIQLHSRTCSEMAMMTWTCLVTIYLEASWEWAHRHTVQDHAMVSSRTSSKEELTTWDKLSSSICQWAREHQQPKDSQKSRLPPFHRRKTLRRLTAISALSLARMERIASSFLANMLSIEHALLPGSRTTITAQHADRRSLRVDHPQDRPLTTDQKSEMHQLDPSNTCTTRNSF